MREGPAFSRPLFPLVGRGRAVALQWLSVSQWLHSRMSNSVTVLPLIACLSTLAGGCVIHHTAAARTPTMRAELTTVVSEDSRLRARQAGVRVIVRDVDAPDQPVSQAFVMISASSRAAIADVKGVATITPIDSGSYSIRVSGAGYEVATFLVRLRPACLQVLEVYLPRFGVMFDRCQVRTASSPPCPPEPKPTPSRAVLTTCAPAS